MSTATVMSAATGVWPGDCRVYSLDTPHEGFSNVAVCVLDYPGLQAVEVLAATPEGQQSPNEDGALHSLTRLDFMTHSDALAALGYQEAV